MNKNRHKILDVRHKTGRKWQLAVAVGRKKKREKRNEK